MQSTDCPPVKILVVDDDVRIHNLISRVLTREGFDVLLAKDAEALQSILQHTTVDLMVLDVMMPGEDGFSVCRRLRAAGDRTPIIMLTARDQDADCISGLTLGADDYVSKPFNNLELLARIQAVLRRRPTKEAPVAVAADQSVFHFGDFTFDLSTRRLHKKDQELHLTTADFLLLRALVRNPGIPMSRDRLAALCNGRESIPFSRSVDVRVAHLRKLLEADTNDPKLIQTVWNVGYVFTPQTE